MKSNTLLIKVVGWALIMGLSGVDAVAQAASCNTTNYESFFLAPDGKTTIAVTKQAYTWPAAAATAKADGGRLVVITGAEQNSAIFSNLSSNFTVTPRPTSTPAKKAWIDLMDQLNSPAWSVEGSAPIVMPSRFSWADDFSGYSNWAAGQPDGYCTAAEQAAHPDHNCYGEPWAVINSDGSWSDEGNHSPTDVTLKGVVEWPQVTLDCVAPVSPPTVADPEQLPGADTGAQYCTDSTKTQLDECANTTDGGKLCPNERVACNAVFDVPACPDGSTLNIDRDMCQAEPTIVCGTGYTWDASLDRCLASVTCPDGGVLNPNTDQCEKLVLNNCPSGYVYDSNTTSPTYDKCIKPVECASGSYNMSKDRCESAPSWNCPTGFSYNSSTAKCEAAPSCASGTTYNATSNRCEASLAACPAGYSYNAVLDKCVVAATCTSGGAVNGTTDKCEISSSVSCPTGTTYNATSGKCESSPVCAVPGTYSASYDLCLTPTSGTVCPTGYSYSASVGACIASPSCVGGTYSTVNNRCEASPSYSCSDPSYTYNSGSGRCEKAPVCSQGSYNSTYNVCLQSIINTCPTEYSYNSTTGRCERAPVCPSGTTFNSITNRCEAPATSITGYTQPVTGETEIIKYKGRGDTSTGITQYSTSPPALDSLSFDFILQDGQVVLKQECAWGGSGNCGCDRPNWDGLCWAGTDLTQTRTGNTLTVVATIFRWGRAGKIYTTGAAASADSSEFVSCPAGYTMTAPPSASTCTTIVSQWGVQTGITDCTQAGLYTCTAPVNACSSGYTLSGSVCYQNPTCPGGSFDYGAHVCYTSYTATCSAGTIYDGSIGSCTIAPTCSNGLLDGSRDVCYQSATAGCSSGYLLSGLICVATPGCATGGTLDGTIDYCSAAVTWQCPAGYAYSSTSGQCYKASSCVAGSLNTSVDLCQQSFSLNCPSGYTLNGTVCQSTPTCTTGGTYDTAINLCKGSNSLCGTLSFDASTDKCYQAAACTGGTLNTSTDKCEATATANCGTSTWDGTLGVCYSSPVCSLGAYDAGFNLCTGAITKECGSYTLKDSTTCQLVPPCPTDANFTLNSTIAYSTELNKCASQTQHDCVTGTTYMGLPVEKCEAIPICANGVYFPDTDTCYNSNQSCPLGDFQCRQLAGDTTMAAPNVPMQYCSPNTCQSDTSGWIVNNDTESGLNDKKNDGEHGANGECLGNIYLYNGTDMRCRLADRRGMTASYLKLIAQIVLTCTGAGAALAAALAAYGQAAVLVAQAVVQVAINTSIDAVTTGVNPQASIISGVVAIAGAAASGALQGAADTASSSLGDTVADAVASAGLSTGFDALADPALSDVIQQIGNVVQDYQPAIQQGLLASYSETKCCYPDKMSGSCKPEEFTEAKLAGNGACHVIGSYCSSRTLSVCMVKKQTSCCFSSKLGRIFHEQGRPQLQAFGEDGGWGNPRSPNCRGFTPDEFQALNFGAMDLTEYVQDLELKMDKVQPLVEQYMQTFGTSRGTQLGTEFKTGVPQL